jgi:hypothetical protein
MVSGWFNPLFNISLLADTRSRSISAENPDGSAGGGARAVPDAANPASDLGPGWKVRPCITLPRGATVTLADITGPGTITRIWITVDHTKGNRHCTIRMYWDDETEPSVETPLGDFFAHGFGLSYVVNSMPVAVYPNNGMNCFWPMPFRKRCRITVQNEYSEDIQGFFYQIDYALGPVPDEAAYFHAQWRHSMTTREHPEHVLLDGVSGRGHYVGTFIAWTQLSNGWWGEGEAKFYLDEDTDHPTICTTGTEDYFGGAWGFDGKTYSGPFLGYPLYRRESGEVPKHALYRWHLPDPIRFTRRIRAAIQALGWWPNGKYQPLTDDLASVAYWYQTEPHGPYPRYPALSERWPR